MPWSFGVKASPRFDPEQVSLTLSHANPQAIQIRAKTPPQPRHQEGGGGRETGKGPPSRIQALTSDSCPGQDILYLPGGKCGGEVRWVAFSSDMNYNYPLKIFPLAPAQEWDHLEVSLRVGPELNSEESL